MKFTYTTIKPEPKPNKLFKDLPCNEIFYAQSDFIGLCGPYIKINQNNIHNTIALENKRIFTWPCGLIYSYYFPQEVNCNNLIEFK